jgi:hypothetical protein
MNLMNWTKGRLYQITLNFGSIELQCTTEPGLFNRRVVHLLFTVRSLERRFRENELCW